MKRYTQQGVPFVIKVRMNTERNLKIINNLKERNIISCDALFPKKNPTNKDDNEGQEDLYSYVENKINLQKV
jgi:hypothetical protein